MEAAQANAEEAAMSKPVTPQEMFDMWQKMVNPGAYPLQSFMFPALDPKEIQKKIGELEAVEHWLKANVNVIQLTVKSLQYQLALLKGGEKAQEVFAEGHRTQDDEVPNPAAWAWKMMNPSGQPEEGAAPKAKKKKKAG
jgi:hypothetical protein